MEGDSLTFKTFDNYTIIMTKWQNKNVMSVLFLSGAYFWVNSAGYFGEFHVVFHYFENLPENHIELLEKHVKSKQKTLKCIFEKIKLTPR